MERTDSLCPLKVRNSSECTQCLIGLTSVRDGDDFCVFRSFKPLFKAEVCSCEGVVLKVPQREKEQKFEFYSQKELKG